MVKIIVLNPSYVKNFCRSARWAARSRGRVQRHPDYLAIATAVLEEADNECELIDAACMNIPLEEVKKRIEKFEPEITVVHTTTPSIYNDIKHVEVAKNVGSMTVLVGSHASALPIETLEISEKIDAIARGEFDYTLRDLAKVADGQIGFKDVLGITYRENGNIKQTEDRPFIEDLDELPFPAWHHIDVHNYFDAGKLYPFITLISGRGCPYRCSFCVLPQVLYGRKYRFRSAKRVVDEIEYDLEIFPDLKEIMFEDDTLTASRKRCSEICHEILERGIDVSWSANARVDLIDLDLLKLMKKAGCRMLVVGFEFGCQKILDAVSKGITLDIMKKFSRLARQVNIKIHGCFMIGGPFETRDTAEETIKLAKELDCDTLQFSALTPYPGTEFYEWCEKNGFIVAKDWTDWLDAGEQSTVISYPQLTREEIIELVDKGIGDFYFSPRMWLHHLITIRDISDFKRKTKGFLGILNYYKTKRKITHERKENGA